MEYADDLSDLRNFTHRVSNSFWKLLKASLHLPSFPACRQEVLKSEIILENFKEENSNEMHKPKQDTHTHYHAMKNLLRSTS